LVKGTHPPLIAEARAFLGQAGGDLARRTVPAFDEKTESCCGRQHRARSRRSGLRDRTSATSAPRRSLWNTISYDRNLHPHFCHRAAGKKPRCAAWRCAVHQHVLAVEAKTGKIRWHYQMNPADDWDRAPHESMLVDLTTAGAPGRRSS
jgi:quinohemoprotein ethanol dehydrogenase